MAAAGHNTENVSHQGGGEWTVGAAGVLDVLTGGQLQANGTQASHIADPSGGGTVDTEARAAIDAILVVIEGIGATATS